MNKTKESNKTFSEISMTNIDREVIESLYGKDFGEKSNKKLVENLKKYGYENLAKLLRDNYYTIQESQEKISFNLMIDNFNSIKEK